MIWKINEEELFAVNPTIQPQIVEVGSERNQVVIVDNFYQNPYQVRHLALNAPTTQWKDVTYGFPMWRTSLDLNLEPIRVVLSRIASEVWGYEIQEVPRFMTNLCIDDTNLRKNPLLSGAPHCDRCVIAAVLYLNIPEESHGGTAFYRHKETGLESLPRHPFFQEDLKRIEPLAAKYGCQNLKEFAEKVIFNEKAFRKELCITDSTDQWEMLKVVEMKFNRLVFYEGKVFHSVYGQEGHFQDYYRIVQAMFWNGAKPVAKS